MTDPTFNLSALANRFFDEKRLLKLAGNIRRSCDLHSLRTDLVMALESLEALGDLLKSPADQNDHGRLITESALLNNAIILYARATKTQSKERAGFDLRAQFSDAQKKIHKEICDLRDRAIAHFGSGGSYQGEWQAELVILQFKGKVAKPGVVTRRQTLDKNLLTRIGGQVRTALELLTDRYRSLLDEVTAELANAAEKNPDFHKEIARHPLNLDVFMKSREAADAARASFDRGYAKGAVSHR